MAQQNNSNSNNNSAGISSGFLRTKISLKGNQSQLSLVSPFYGMKPELPRNIFAEKQFEAYKN